MKDKIVVFIYAYTADYGYPPTYDDIGRACGISSKSQVKKLLDELEEEGRITRKKGSPRTVRVL